MCFSIWISEITPNGCIPATRAGVPSLNTGRAGKKFRMSGRHRKKATGGLSRHISAIWWRNRKVKTRKPETRRERRATIRGNGGMHQEDYFGLYSNLRARGYSWVIVTTPEFLRSLRFFPSVPSVFQVLIFATEKINPATPPSETRENAPA